jgi:hypothetical protein
MLERLSASRDLAEPTRASSRRGDLRAAEHLAPPVRIAQTVLAGRGIATPAVSAPAEAAAVGSRKIRCG